MPEYFERRLETSTDHQFYHLWITIPISCKFKCSTLLFILIYFNKIICLKEPNPEDPLNKEAADVLQSNKWLFEQNVAKSMKGGYVGNAYFDRCLK